MKVESLAGTGAEYTLLQAYTREDTLHIQGKGDAVNRSYGLSLDIPRDKFPYELWEWLTWVTEEKGDMKSLAESDVCCYFPIQVKARETDFHFQVKSDPTHNRSYGAAFGVPKMAYPDLEKFVV